MTTKHCCDHTRCSKGDSSTFGEFSLARDDLHTEPLEIPRGERQNENQKKCSTLGERRMKTQGSMMELMEMKRRAIRSVG